MLQTYLLDRFRANATHILCVCCKRVFKVNSLVDGEVFAEEEAFFGGGPRVPKPGFAPKLLSFSPPPTQSHHKKHPRITKSCWQLPSLARKLPRLLESKPWKETRPFARRRKKWARKVKRKEKRCVCRIIFYTKMEKEQRAKEREEEGERAFYLLSSLSISFVFVLLWWCSLLQSSSPIERKRRGICYSTHHHGRRRSDLLWSSSSFTS